MTYGFLGVMAVALITLAVLQYHWLGSVSDAEKKRLEETLDASSTNFVADLNRNFSQLSQVFKLQITKGGREIEEMLGDAYLEWISKSIYPDLVDSVFYIRSISSNDTEIQLFESDPARLSNTEVPGFITQWLKNQKESKQSPSSKIDIMRFPELGEPSLMSVPVQVLDLITMENMNAGSNFSVSLNIDQADHVVLIQLNDDAIKKQIVPDIARTYFSESYDDQYNISFVKSKDDEQRVYLTSVSEGKIPEPDVKKALRSFDLSSVFVLQTNRESTRGTKGFSVFKSTDSLSSHIESIRVNTGNAQERRGIFQGFSTWAKHSESPDQRMIVRADTTITASITADLSTANWEFWLSLKEGSLDKFVAKTKNKNLAISFGILLILGFCIVMIVVLSQRSRDLAEKQMLFVAGVSHELRTPLTVIRSAAENLTEGVIQDEQRKKQYADLMLKEGRRLSDMVDQIMEFSGIQSGKRVYQFSSVNLNDFVLLLNEECKMALQEKGMQLEYSLSSDIKDFTADRDAIFLALSNLIKNAIKFSGESKKIQLRIDNQEVNTVSSIRFQVQDFGVGIPEDELKSIFEPFYRGKRSVEEQVKGNGIGLSLVSKVAKAHDGSVTVKSKVGEGSTFTLVIPVEQHGK